MEKRKQLIFLEDIKGIVKAKNKNGHLYVLSDDKIKEGDWYYTPIKRSIEQCNKSILIIKGGNNDVEQLKIIATTDTELSRNMKLGTYIPKPSQSFIEKYVESYNAGKPITDVLVEYEEARCHAAYPQQHYCVKPQCTCFAIPFKLKINPKDNTITIKRVKDSWNREEIEVLLGKLHDDLADTSVSRFVTFNKWISENI